MVWNSCVSRKRAASASRTRTGSSRDCAFRRTHAVRAAITVAGLRGNIAVAAAAAVVFDELVLFNTTCLPMPGTRVSVRLTQREHERLTALLERRRADGWTEEELEDLPTVVDQGSYMATFYRMTMYDTDGPFLQLDATGEPVRFHWFYVEAELRVVGRQVVPVVVERATIPGCEIEQALCATGNSRPVEGQAPVILVHRDVYTNSVLVKRLSDSDWWTPF